MHVVLARGIQHACMCMHALEARARHSHALASVVLEREIEARHALVICRRALNLSYLRVNSFKVGAVLIY